MDPKRPNIQVLNSRQLLSFVTVARTRSFTISGKELSLSQSAVSHGVTALEEELNCTLFHRAGKNIYLTPTGEHLLYHAEKILANMTVARESLDRRVEWGKGRLRVGASVCISQCMLPGIVQSFRENFLDWSVIVKPGDTRQCVEWLEQDQIDLAVAIAPSRAGAMELTPIFADEVMWIRPAGHSWSGAASLSQKQIAAQTFICDSTESYTFRLLEKYFKSEGVRLKLGLELGNLEAVKETVRNGMGITALAPWTVREEIDNKSLVAVPLGKRKLKRNWCLLRSPDRKPSLAEETFSKLTAEATSSMSSLLQAAASIFWVAWFSLCANLDELADVFCAE
jgi:DNA-binding transcriptional LysR family regulator